MRFFAKYIPYAKNIRTGNYTGDDSADRFIDIGYTPSLVIITSGSTSWTLYGAPGSNFCLKHIYDVAALPAHLGMVKCSISTGGFTVSQADKEANESPYVYYWTAIA